MLALVDFLPNLWYIYYVYTYGNSSFARWKIMKKRDILVNAVVNLIFTLIACVFAGVFSSMLVKLINKFVLLDFIVDAAVKAILLFLFSAFFVLLFSYKNGYHSLCFDKKETVLSSLLATAAHFALSLVTVFSPWIAGATKHVGGFIEYGDNYMSEYQMLNIPIPTLLLAGLFSAIVYAGLLVLGTYVGMKKRLSDRAKLLGENPQESK